MRELKEFIGNTKFVDLKEIFDPIKVTIKDHNNLYMLSFEDDANFENKVVRQCNGTIFEKDTNILVHFSFEKCYDGYSGDKDSYNYDNIGENYTIEPFFEGSTIRIFYYEEEWKMGTSRRIEADTSYWTSQKSFKELFIEGIKSTYNDINFKDYLETLDKNNCYTYLLQHPENRMLIKTDIALVYQINEIESHTLKLEL